MDHRTKKLLRNAWRENRLVALHVDLQPCFLDGRTIPAFEGVRETARLMRRVGVPNLWMAFTGSNHPHFGRLPTVAEFHACATTYNGDAISDRVEAHNDEVVTLKDVCSGFAEEDNVLDYHMQSLGADTIIIDGVYTDACVNETLKKGLLKNRYNFIVNTDGMDWDEPREESERRYASSLLYHFYPETKIPDRRFGMTNLQSIESALRPAFAPLEKAMPPFLKWAF